MHFSRVRIDGVVKYRADPYQGLMEVADLSLEGRFAPHRIVAIQDPRGYRGQ